MSTERPGANQFFNEVANAFERTIARKKYDRPEYAEEISMVASGFARAETVARAIRAISMLDHAFDNVMLNIFVLGAKMTGGRLPGQE